MTDSDAEDPGQRERRLRRAWEYTVGARYKHRCAGCGEAEALRAVPLVPFDTGGRLDPSNGVLLCLVCEISREASRGEGEVRDTPVCVWVSRELSLALEAAIASPKGYGSRSRMVDEMMGLLVASPERWETLVLYQEHGPGEVKCNLRVERQRYVRFCALARKHRMRVREAVVALVLLYLETMRREPA